MTQKLDGEQYWAKHGRRDMIEVKLNIEERGEHKPVRKDGREMLKYQQKLAMSQIDRRTIILHEEREADEAHP